MLVLAAGPAAFMYIIDCYISPRTQKLQATHTIMDGGEGRIRTSEGVAGRFTVCSLWPLGNLTTCHKNRSARQAPFYAARHTGRAPAQIRPLTAFADYGFNQPPAKYIYGSVPGISGLYACLLLLPARPIFPAPFAFGSRIAPQASLAFRLGPVLTPRLRPA